MSENLHKLCQDCKYSCKMFEMVAIVSCKRTKESTEAKKRNVEYTEEYERKYGRHKEGK